jgi:soluble lytic murein transglycosylase-like protein
VPYICIAVIAIAASLPAMTLLVETPLKASSEPVPHRELALLAKQRRMPYSPASPSSNEAEQSAPDSREPALWTVRSRYDGLIESMARRHDVDPALVKAIVQAESAFDPKAVSRSGARGLMQVLPTTASRFSIKNLSDPRQNLRAGVLYLKHLLDLFDGDVTMAVAAYNAGPNSVRRHRGVPPYSETRNYLAKVMGLRRAYADSSRRS